MQLSYNHYHNLPTFELLLIDLPFYQYINQFENHRFPRKLQGSNDRVQGTSFQDYYTKCLNYYTTNTTIITKISYLQNKQLANMMTVGWEQNLRLDRINNRIIQWRQNGTPTKQDKFGDEMEYWQIEKGPHEMYPQNKAI